MDKSLLTWMQPLDQACLIVGGVMPSHVDLQILIRMLRLPVIVQFVRTGQGSNAQVILQATVLVRSDEEADLAKQELLQFLCLAWKTRYTNAVL